MESLGGEYRFGEKLADLRIDYDGDGDGAGNENGTRGVENRNGAGAEGDGSDGATCGAVNEGATGAAIGAGGVLRAAVVEREMCIRDREKPEAAELMTMETADDGTAENGTIAAAVTDEEAAEAETEAETTGDKAYGAGGRNGPAGGEPSRCGFVALLGAPNAGQSTPVSYTHLFCARSGTT